MQNKNLLKLSWKTEWFSWLIIAACIVSAFYFYAHFPDRIASHWDFNGEVNGWMPKSFGVIFLPALILGMYLLFIILPYIDPKRERYSEFVRPYAIFRSMIVAVLGLLYFVTGFYNLGYPVDVGAITAGSIGLMMIIIGNYLGKIKKNWFVGIRTPWTLSSENVWNKTHRVSGWLFMLWGLAIILAPWLPETWAMILLLGGAVVMVLGTTLYSYIIFRQEKNEK